MERILELNPLDQEALRQFSGRFTTTLHGEVCQLELATHISGNVQGYLHAKGQSFRLYGRVSPQSNTLYGVLLADDLPTARITLKIKNDQLQLRLFSTEGMPFAEAKMPIPYDALKEVKHEA